MTRHEWALLSTPQVPTFNSGMASADLCRMNNWTPGTKLAGDEGFGVTIIRVTALGEKNILAERELSNGKTPAWRYESVQNLHDRDWRKVPA